METNIAVFRGKGIRKIIHKNEWWFSASDVDVVEVITDSVDPRQYIKKMKQRDPELNSNWGTICTLLKIVGPDGKDEGGKMSQHRRCFPHYPIRFNKNIFLGTVSLNTQKLGDLVV